MFLDHLRQHNLICNHSGDSFEFVSGPGREKEAEKRIIRCKTCQCFTSITDFLCNIVHPAVSSTLAHEYGNETGDVHIPCTFSIEPLKLRVLPTTVCTRFSVLHRGLNLLRAIHSPFVEGADENASRIDPKLFQNLMTEYLCLIDRVSSASGNDREGSDRLAVKTILTNMKDAFSNVDMFDQYFNVLAPYVKRAAASTETETGCVFSRAQVQEEVSTLPFGHALFRELEKSAYIHEKFSKYCIPFDVVHVMVLCYLCGDAIDVVYNLVLDLGAKLCSGYFSFPVSSKFSVGRDIQKFLDRNVTPTKNLKLYYHLQKYKTGGNDLVECFSEDFLRCYGELDTEIRKNVPLANSDDKIQKFVYMQTFPYMLFESKSDERDDTDYFAFVLALAHYASKSTMGAGCIGSIAGTTVPKGVLSECKKIFKFAKKCMMRVRNFHGNESKERESKIYWTKDMFNVFVASDPEFGRELVDMIGTMIVGQ